MANSSNIITVSDGKLLLTDGRKRQTRISEDDLIHLIMVNLALFGWLIQTMFEKVFDSLGYGDGVYAAPLVPRKKLDLPREGKPGDIDMLIIPYYDGKADVTQTMVIEVKVCRPTQAKPSKSTDTTGRAQAQGLIDAGFPHVGLLHLVIAEGSPQENYKLMLAGKVIANDEVIDLHYIPVDMFPAESAERHFQWLQRRQLHASISTAVMALTIKWSEMKVGSYQQLTPFISGHSIPLFRPGYLNPKTNISLQHSIHALVKNNSPHGQVNFLQIPRFSSKKE